MGCSYFRGIWYYCLGAPEILLKGDTLPKTVVEAQQMGKRILLVGYTKETVKEEELPSITAIAAIENWRILLEKCKRNFRFFQR